MSVSGHSGGQFHVAISSRLPLVSLPRLDALSELLEITATDLPGGVRSGCGHHGHRSRLEGAIAGSGRYAVDNHLAIMALQMGPSGGLALSARESL